MQQEGEEAPIREQEASPALDAVDDNDNDSLHQLQLRIQYLNPPLLTALYQRLHRPQRHEQPVVVREPRHV